MKNIHKLNGHLLYPLLFSGICYLVSSQLVITMPRTSFPRHSEINDSSATYVEVVSLEDVQQLEEILSGHDLILSFITYDGYLLVQGKSVTSSVYSLGETIRDLENSLKSDPLYYSCHQHLLPYRLAVQSLLHSTIEKQITVITDNSKCSTSFLSTLQKNLEEDEHGHIHADGLILEINLLDEGSLRDQLYNLRVGNTHVFLLLLPKDYHRMLFTFAQVYGLLEGYNVWIVPNFEDKDLLIFPEKTVRFSLKHNYNDNYEIPRIVSKLERVYNEISASNLTELDNTSIEEYSIRSRLYRTAFEAFFSESVADKMKFEVEVQYKDVKNPSKGWTTTHMQMDNHVFQLLSNQIGILQTIGHSHEFTIKEKLKVAVILDEPYIFLNSEIYNKELQTCTEGLVCTEAQYMGGGQSCCVGFIIDIFMLILERLNMNFEMYIVEDGKYGGFNKGVWNGLIGDVVNEKADLAVAGLTITEIRTKYVDFTVPYMFDTAGIITRPEAITLNFINWEFVSPLKIELQITILIVFLSAILLNYFFENGSYIASFIKKGYNFRIEKYYPFVESMTHISGVTLQRDLGGVNPVKPGAMVSSIIYAFGMVIVVTTYTAVLAAFLMQNHEKEPFEGSQDRRFQNPTDDFTFGVLKDSSYEDFFKKSESPVLKRMGIFMEKYNFDNSVPGPELVRRGEIDAIFSDHSFLYYYLSKDQTCQLKLVKDDFISFGLGFAVKKNLPITSLINQVIQRLVDENKVTERRRKWFKNICQPQFFVQTKVELSITGFGGLFLLLIVTIVLCLAFLYPENLWYKYFHQDFLKFVKRTINRRMK